MEIEQSCVARLKYFDVGDVWENPELIEIRGLKYMYQRVRSIPNQFSRPIAVWASRVVSITLVKR